MLAARPNIEPRRTPDAHSVRVTEIYLSIQGESSHAGQLCTFVRLTGCHLRCGYCDSAFAFYEGEQMEIDEVIRRVERVCSAGVGSPGGGAAVAARGLSVDGVSARFRPDRAPRDLGRDRRS